MHESQWAALDGNRRQAFQRAINVAGAGSVLLQTQINKVVQQLTLREFGAQAVLDRRPGSGDKAYINRRSAGATGGSWVADTDGVTEETGGYAQTSFAYRTLATRGRVTRKIQSTGRTYGDLLAQEMTAKAEDFANALENALIIGDNSLNGNQPDGFIKLIGGASGQVVANASATTGGALSLAKLDEAIDLVKGSANRADLAIIGSFSGMRKLNAALQAQQQFVNQTEIAGGFRVRTYDGIPMIVSTEMPNTLAWSGSAVTTYGGGATTALLVVNKRYCWMEELNPVTVMPLAKTDSQFDQFDMFWDGALVFSNTKGAAMLGGISGS
jgi:hypothetical protein